MPQLITAVAVPGTLYGLGTAGGVAAIAADVAVLAAGASAYSSIQQGKFAEEMGEYNAALAQQEAESIEEKGEFEERETRAEGRRIRARQLLQFAKGGVVPTTGTPLITSQKITTDVEKDIRLQRYGFGLQYSRALSRGRKAKREGRAASRASAWQAGSSLLTGTYRASSIYA